MPLRPICFPISWCGHVSHAKIKQGKGDRLKYAELHPFLSSRRNSCRKKSKQHSPCAVLYWAWVWFRPNSTEDLGRMDYCLHFASSSWHSKSQKEVQRLILNSVFLCFLYLQYYIHNLYNIYDKAPFYFLLLIPCPCTYLLSKNYWKN